MTMPQLVALSLSIGILGGIATFVFLKFLTSYLIWAAFIAWGCFFATGGNTEALKNTIVCTIFGAFVAWVAALILVSVPMADSLGLPAWAGIVVGGTVLVLCLAAHLKPLATIPASVYGYASVFAFLLAGGGANLTKESLMSASPQHNALIAVAVSLLIGALLGLVSGKVAAALTKPA
jgi:Protein of unknown function (DUF1097)